MEWRSEHRTEETELYRSKKNPTYAAIDSQGPIDQVARSDQVARRVTCRARGCRAVARGGVPRSREPRSRARERLSCAHEPFSLLERARENLVRAREREPTRRARATVMYAIKCSNQMQSNAIPAIKCIHNSRLRCCYVSSPLGTSSVGGM